MEDGSLHLCICSQSEAVHIFESNSSSAKRDSQNVCGFSDVEDNLFPVTQGETQQQYATLQDGSWKCCESQQHDLTWQVSPREGEEQLAPSCSEETQKLT